MSGLTDLSQKSWMFLGPSAISNYGQLDMNNQNIVNVNTINGFSPSSGSSQNSIIYQQGGSSTAPFVNNWAAVVSAINAASGMITVYIDNTVGQCVASSSVNGLGKLVFANSNVQSSGVLQISNNGTVITDIGALVNITLQNQSTTVSPLVFDNVLHLETLGCNLVNTSYATVPFISFNNPSASSALLFTNFCTMDNSANPSIPIVNVATNCSCQVIIVNSPGFFAAGSNQITSVDNTGQLFLIYDSAGSPYASSDFTGTINNTAIDMAQYIQAPGSTTQVVYNNNGVMSGTSTFTFAASTLQVPNVNANTLESTNISLGSGGLLSTGGNIILNSGGVLQTDEIDALTNMGNLDIGSNSGSLLLDTSGAGSKTINIGTNTATTLNIGNSGTTTNLNSDVILPTNSIYVNNIDANNSNALRLGVNNATAITIGKNSTITTVNGQMQTPEITSSAASGILALNCGVQYSHLTTTSNYTVSNPCFYIGCDTSSNTITVTLPSTPAIGETFVVKDEGGSAITNNITITPSSGTIDGQSTLVINTNYDSYGLYFAGGNWFTW